MSLAMATRPQIPPMLEAILHAARDKFPGHDWASVEDHIRKAWNAMAHEAPWEEVSDPARQAWEAALK